jgi:signal transduction histidine kinase
MTIALPELITTVAYFSIPVQLLASLWQYPQLAAMPYKIVFLLVLLSLSVFFCGLGHLLRCLGKADTDFFYCNSILLASATLAAALYLLPLIPNLFGIIDQSIRDSIKQTIETAESKAQLVTFMAFLCHEIRNPLFAITSSTQFLADTEMTEEQAIGVGSISDSSLLMLRLVNDVLDLSKIDAGKLDLEGRDFDLHRLLENLEVNMRLQIEQKHGDKVKLDFEVSKDVPQNVYGDSTRVLQIVYNLISNSCKFTEQGFIKLSVGVCDDESINGNISSNDCSDSSASLVYDDMGSDQFSMGLLDSAEEGTIRHNNRGVHLKIAISDSGVGIDPERLSKIFSSHIRRPSFPTTACRGVWFGTFRHFQSLEPTGREHPSRVPGWERNPRYPHFAYTGTFGPRKDYRGLWTSCCPVAACVHRVFQITKGEPSFDCPCRRSRRGCQQRHYPGYFEYAVQSQDGEQRAKTTELQLSTG